MTSMRGGATRDMEDHVGHVLIGELQLGATLTQSEGRISLRVALDGSGRLALPEDGLLRFRAATGYFTLIGLRSGGSQLLLGVAGSATVLVQHAIKNADFTSLDDIHSATWLLYVEDLPEIHHVNGFRQEFVVGEGGARLLTWSYSSPAKVELDCSKAGLQVALGQDAETTPETRDQAAMTFAYPMAVTFPEEIGLYDALPIFHRIRQFCSLMVGRVLDIERVILRLPQEGRGFHNAEVFGIYPARRSDRPAHRIAAFEDPAALARLLDAWLDRADTLEDAIDLHFEALEKADLGLPLRFQQFIQAIEAAHRRSGAPVGDPIKVDVVVETLQEQGIDDSLVDRVRGMLAHAHEPGLRQRLRAYWDRFAPELAVLRPDLQRNAFINRLVATRNFYAHGLDLSSDVLQHEDLWDGTEFVKAMSHLILLEAIGADLSGVGQRMLDERFVQFSIRSAPPSS